MNVLVDTCVWSLALRRTSPVTNEYTSELIDLIKEQRAQLIGPIRQELLSGIKHAEQFERLRATLASFNDITITTGNYELAASLFNHLRSEGIQASQTDALICSVSLENQIPILTTDNDFKQYAYYTDINLLKPRQLTN